MRSSIRQFIVAQGLGVLLIHCLVWVYTGCYSYGYVLCTVCVTSEFLFTQIPFSSILNSIKSHRTHSHIAMNSTADFTRRRYEQYKRVIELEQATQHISPPSDLEQNKWGRIKWYYKQYGMFLCCALLWLELFVTPALSWIRWYFWWGCFLI